MINGVPNFLGRIPTVAGVTLRVQGDVNEIAVDATIRLTKINGSRVVRSKRRKIVAYISRDGNVYSI